MNKRDNELIASVLGDAAPSPALRRWLHTEEGQRELSAYRQTVDALNRVYREVPTEAPQPMVRYAEIHTPVGRVWIAATDAGLVRVSFRQSEAAFVTELRRRLRAQVVKSPAELAGIVVQLQAYFARTRRTFDLPLDLCITTPFQRRVLMATRAVPPGKVVSYGEIARRIHQPTASRAVGQALNRNPIPIVIPCHRIVSGSGGLGGYAGGLTIKKKLLGIEAA